MALFSLQVLPPPNLRSSLPLSTPSLSFPFPHTLSLQTSKLHTKLTHTHLLFHQPRCSPTTQTPTQEQEQEQEQEVKEAAQVFDRRRLIAQNIPWTATEDDIRALFEKQGTVLNVDLPKYRRNRNKGLAFITMASEEEALAAINNLNSSDLDGRGIRVEFSTSLKKNPPPVLEAPPKGYSVYVGNLAWNVKSQNLRELFDATGKVLSGQVVYQSNPRRPAGHGFVSFASKEEAEAAIATLNGKTFMGRPLRLGFSKLETDNAEGTSEKEVQVDAVLSESNTNAEIPN